MTLSVDHTNIHEHDYYDEHDNYSVCLKQQAHHQFRFSEQYSRCSHCTWKD